MTSKESFALQRLNQKHLWTVAEQYREKAPELASYYQWQYIRELQLEVIPSIPSGIAAHLCPRCGKTWTREEGRITANKRPVCKNKIKRLQRKVKRGGTLSQKDSNLVKEYGQLRVSIKCEMCKSTLKYDINASKPAKTSISTPLTAVDSISMLAAERRDSFTPRSINRTATRVQHNLSFKSRNLSAEKQGSSKKKRKKKGNETLNILHNKLQESTQEARRGSLSAFLLSL